MSTDPRLMVITITDQRFIITTCRKANHAARWQGGQRSRTATLTPTPSH